MKPKVAFALQDKARGNLQRKLDLLRSSIEQEANLAAMPSSVRQFNAWAKDTNEATNRFERNANETLNRNPAMRSAVVELTALVKDLRQKRTRGRDESLARAREHVKLHKTIREIAEGEMRRARKEVQSLREENIALRAQCRSIAEEAERVKEQYERDLAKERKVVADLRSSRERGIRAVK